MKRPLTRVAAYFTAGVLWAVITVAWGSGAVPDPPAYGAAELAGMRPRDPVLFVGQRGAVRSPKSKVSVKMRF